MTTEGLPCPAFDLSEIALRGAGRLRKLTPRHAAFGARSSARVGRRARRDLTLIKVT